MISVIIPARNEPYLAVTISDVLDKASQPQNVEVVAVLDGYWPDPPIQDQEGVVLLHLDQPRGMRQAINAGVDASRGEYLMKLDAHCSLAPGWDGSLPVFCESNTVIVPRRKRLDPKQWQLTDIHKPDVDYEALRYPTNPTDGIRGVRWEARAIANVAIAVDETPTMQGSCYFLRRDYWDWLELLDAERWGSFRLEAQEISLKAWLSGGRVLVDKGTWYAHWHKPGNRGYPLSGDDQQRAMDYSRRFLTELPWSKQIHPLRWLIERFEMPGWPEGWWQGEKS